MKTKNQIARTEEEKKALTIRLNKIEGQMRGMKQMVAEDRSCDDILIQISAAIHSLQGFGNTILKIHLSTYMVEELKKENLAVVDEIITLFGRID